MSAYSFKNIETPSPTKSQISTSACPQGYVAILWLLIPVAFHVSFFVSKMHCNTNLALDFVIVFVNEIV